MHKQGLAIVYGAVWLPVVTLQNVIHSGWVIELGIVTIYSLSYFTFLLLYLMCGRTVGVLVIINAIR